MNDADLEAFLTRHGVIGNIVRLAAHTPTVETAAQVMGTTVERIAKSLLFLLEQGEAGAEPLLVIANGTGRVDYRSVAGSVGLPRKRVRLADAATVESVTGYPVGGVPPLGHPRPLRTLIDRRVLSEPEVYAGGGALHALLRIAPAEIVRVTGAQTVDVVGEAAQRAGPDR
jgi:prolyl-tRNA editing enzyme YbaK/EbsC (Cys-tRNA(Pro) deacylase)